MVGWKSLINLTTLTTLFTIHQVSAVPIQSKAGLFNKRETFSGDGTYYNPGLGSCEVVSGPTQLIAALNAPQFGSYPRPRDSPACFSCAKVHGPKGSVQVQIVDTCPSCKEGSLDLSPTAFEHIANLTQGRVHITWNYVACGKESTSPSPSPSPSHIHKDISTSSPISVPTTKINVKKPEHQSAKPKPTEVQNTTTTDTEKSQPTASDFSLENEQCHFERRCTNPGVTGEFETCINGSIDLQVCADGTVCKADNGDIICTWASK
ncbi:hypothetical protein K7432_016022 [Basidiobolus ranarum]|uniref:RlpA-like protein double-psi beta-barrel domain-containing protein n=1 Tax=Basidiobolus ranarum TaxID=34480 RepID=A0ABR2VM74_9FUNG